MTWLTSKIQADDVPILEKIGRAARLKDQVEMLYRKKGGADKGLVLRELPHGAPAADWTPRPLFYMGLKLGSKAAFTETGKGVYKGLNIFPGGLKGEPMGQWDGVKAPQDLKIYRYSDFFAQDRLFASREIAQLPTIAPVPAGAVFNNTVILIQMRERFPLNGWVLARPVMFAAATCLRATIVEDLVCHWYPKNLNLIPMPLSPSAEDLMALETATEQLVHADENLADRWRQVEAELSSQPTMSISQLIANGALLVEGFALPPPATADTVLQDLLMNESGITAGNGSFVLAVPNADLRAVIWYQLDRKINDGEEVQPSSIGALKIPAEPAAVAAIIRDVHGSDAAEAFETARRTLDAIAARLLGLSDDDLAYIEQRFITDPFLSQVRPMWAHRGLHVQSYHDHSGGDRFAS
ncbi:hypothetical protein QTI24_29190 [Variovorax sp. J22P240]|uniref:hypothetical protein n=1 Tax=Variovorax sp. J22P240 TaxID=3053514 RepID=UPI00257513E5|nr:hypothetical protein [Variovorax sp. J22P240]MDM0002708.1 hypothetical protein [Variovorax sp. J22P240]